jgi:sugar phosphate isomerase/epimerase
LRVTVVFGGFEGESYADIPTVGRTVGLVPLATRKARTAEMKEIADFARLLDAEAVGLHLGQVPAAGHPDYAGVLEATRGLCDYCRPLGLNVHLETGQETADALLEFLNDAQRDNLFVNFDPANMILYGAGDPIEALGKVGRFVRSVHCKDAKWAAKPGIDWGTEVPLGQGDVDFAAFLRTLDQFGYHGPLTIERETSPDAERQKAEIGQGIRLLNQLKAKKTT